MRARGVEVVEVNRPNRQHRRRFGKHDTADAEAAARAVHAKYRHWRTEKRRRAGGGSARAARCAPFGGESAYPGCQLAARPALHGPGGAQGRAAGSLDYGTGGHHLAFPPQQGAQRPGGGDQACDEVDRSSSPQALGGDRRTRRAARAVGHRGHAPLVSLKGVGTDTAAASTRSTFSTALLIDSRLLVSHIEWGSNLQPCASSGAIDSTLRAVAYTVQPFYAKRSAVAHPMPGEQPVIKTALEVHVDPIPDAMPLLLSPGADLEPPRLFRFCWWRPYGIISGHER